MATIHIETGQVGGIPILTMKPEGIRNQPAVLFVHGFGHDKQQGLSLGYEVASRGMNFIALDAPMHGDRFDPHLERVAAGEADLVYPAGTGLDTFFLMHEVIVQTARDITELIDHFQTDPAVDAGAVGLTGFSMGGFATFYAVAVEKRIQAAVTMAGVPAFESRWKDVVLEASSYPEWSADMSGVEEKTEECTRFMRRHDPFRRAETFSPRPLLIINGDLDTDSPKKYAVDMYRRLKPLYSAHPERLRFSIYDEVGHQMTREMVGEACSWFERYLTVDD